MTKGKALFGVLVGFAAGAAIGIVMAPGKGVRTRRNITRKGQVLTDAIKDAVEDNFDKLLESLRDRVVNLRKDNETTSAARNSLK